MKKKKNRPTPYVSCIVAAAGKGSRMQADVNKIFLEYADMPVLAHTLLALEQARVINEIILVTSEYDVLGCRDIAEEFAISKLKTITIGGDQRQDSVYNALQETSPQADIVLIHDAARPLITAEVIENVVAGVLEHGAAAAGVPCKNTLKTVDANGLITATPDRSRLYEVQTPQGFNRALILRAHTYAREKELSGTDDCYLVEQLGADVKIVPGDYCNIKITTPEDLAIAELFDRS